LPSKRRNKAIAPYSPPYPFRRAAFLRADKIKRLGNVHQWITRKRAVKNPGFRRAATRVLASYISGESSYRTLVLKVPDPVY
jgi:hypothetical protein